MTYTVRYGISVRMLGPNGRGHGARRGHVMHAVVTDERGLLVSLCKYSPSYDWSEAYAQPVSCPKCQRKLMKVVAL